MAGESAGSLPQHGPERNEHTGRGRADRQPSARDMGVGERPRALVDVGLLPTCWPGSAIQVAGWILESAAECHPARARPEDIRK